MEDDGEYTCIISNSFGSISHTIQVRFPPLVSNAPELVELELLWGAAIILGAGIILVSRNYFGKPELFYFGQPELPFSAPEPKYR